MFRTASLSFFIIAGTLLASPQVPNTDTQKSPPSSPELKAILDRLDKIEQTIKTSDTDQTKRLTLWAEMFQKDINEIREWLGRVQKDINEIKVTRGMTETLKPVEGGGKVTMLLVNAHQFMTMDVSINGAMHSVAPGQSLPVVVPAGSVNFQVIQTDAGMRTRSLPAGVTHVVTMR